MEPNDDNDPGGDPAGRGGSTAATPTWWRSWPGSPPATRLRW